MKLSTTAACLTAFAAIIGLSGCAAGASGSTGELARTKSPTQLVRNEAAQRLMTGTDETVAEQRDYSEACKSKADDPTGLYRSWRSTLLAVVPEDSAVGVDQFVGELATSFSEDGWVFKEDNSEANAKVTTLTRSDSIVTVTLTSTEETGQGGSVLIEASGPCVLTDGPNSAEVRDLES
jgi:hypothetical protein